ncbi:MAG: SIS domain-containing protein [Candidatus Acidiferrum sp.]
MQPLSETHFLSDILRQPSALLRAMDYLTGAGQRKLESAATAVRHSRHVYLTGIGSSYHAALGAGSLFDQGARPVYVQDAAELLHFAAFPTDSVMIVVSRSGQSAEIVRLLAKARKSGTIVIGLTNSEEGALAQEAHIPVVIPVGLDHAISVNTYSTLAAAAAALASITLGSFDRELKTSLVRAANETEKAIPGWREQISSARWPLPQTSYYFLARGSSLASCHEARLLWEEGVKWPATAMGTGGFRHGPQEIVTDGLRFGMWIDGQRMREEDLAVARDLGKLGASVMVIGQNLREDAGDLVLQITAAVPLGWQFLFDIIPAQLVAERLARLSGVDCDSFRICSYIVGEEYGLLADELAVKSEGLRSRCGPTND